MHDDKDDRKSQGNVDFIHERCQNQTKAIPGRESGGWKPENIKLQLIICIISVHLNFKSHFDVAGCYPKLLSRSSS